MPRSTPCCQRYEQDEDEARYFAVVELDTLPKAKETVGHRIEHGWAVQIGQWFFFPAMPPAIAFGRAARMSHGCHGYGIYEAAFELMWCERHNQDEKVLLINHRALVERGDNELQLRMLKRFVQSAKEHPWTAHWLEPTGYLTDYNNGRPVQTTQKSLPL